MNKLPLVSPPKYRDHRRVEIVTEVEPTEQELKEIINLYNEEYNHISGEYANIGFKLRDSEKVLWLDEYASKDSIVFDIKKDKIPIFSAEQLMSNIVTNRDSLLATFNRQTNAEVSK